MLKALQPLCCQWISPELWDILPFQKAWHCLVSLCEVEVFVGRRPVNNWKNKPDRAVPVHVWCSFHALRRAYKSKLHLEPPSFCLVVGRENSVHFQSRGWFLVSVGNHLPVPHRGCGCVAQRLPVLPQANADPSVISCLHNLSRRIAIVLQHEERRCQYLTREAKLILAIQDEVSAMAESECLQQQGLSAGMLFQGGAGCAFLLLSCLGSLWTGVGAL